MSSKLSWQVHTRTAMWLYISKIVWNGALSGVMVSKLDEQTYTSKLVLLGNPFIQPRSTKQKVNYNLFGVIFQLS